MVTMIVSMATKIRRKRPPHGRALETTYNLIGALHQSYGRSSTITYPELDARLGRSREVSSALKSWANHPGLGPRPLALSFHHEDS
jgi:hypothetical protein